MTNDNWLTREMRDSVALVTLALGDGNRVSGPVCDRLRAELKELASLEAVRAVVITGDSKSFCTGLDLDWLKNQPPEAIHPFLMNVSGLLKETACFPKPIIGAISGHAFGLGAIWASGFDFRLVREDRGWICFPEMDIDIPFSPGMIAICEHGLGKRVFREMAWTATRYGGAEAVSVGWARQAVPQAQLVDKSLELAAFMARKGSVAFSFTKIAWARQVAHAVDELDSDAIRRIPLKL